MCFYIVIKQINITSISFPTFYFKIQKTSYVDISKFHVIRLQRYKEKNLDLLRPVISSYRQDRFNIFNGHEMKENKQTNKQTNQMYTYRSLRTKPIKGSVSVIQRDPLFIEGHVRFTTVSLKALNMFDTFPKVVVQAATFPLCNFQSVSYSHCVISQVYPIPTV